MRALRVSIAVVALCACKDKTTGSTAAGSNAGSAAPVPAAAKLDLARVDDDHRVAELVTIPKPVGVAWIDAAGAIDVAKRDAKWPAFPAGDRIRIAGPDQLYRALVGDVDAKLEKDMQDDPPPPPPEEDGSDESGGTGTAMAMDEGKMGKVDSDRAEGQYKMKKNVDDPQLARQQAIEQARAAGILGSTALNVPTFAVATMALVTDVTQVDIVIAPSPAAPAATLVATLSKLYGGAIAVDRGGKLAVLARGYRHELDRAAIPAPWLELHLATDGMHVVEPRKLEQTALAWKGSTVDRDALRDLFVKLHGDGKPEVDVLVAKTGVTTQQLVDVLVAIEASNATPRGLGVLDTSTDERLAALKRASNPKVSLDAPSATGDLDKTVIRKAIRKHISAITYCYEKQLLVNAKLEGTVQTKFVIQRDGKVANVTATGLDPKVAACVAKVIETITFDKPKGGGVVNVNYPFAFRPA